MIKQDQINRLVEAAFEGSKLSAATPLTGGVSAQVLRLDLSHRGNRIAPVVLRVLAGTSGRHTAELEFALLSALFQAGLPVPKPLFLDAHGDWLGRSSLVMSFVDGTTTPPEAAVDPYIETLAKTLASVHNTDVSGLPSLPTRLDPLEGLAEFLPDGSAWTSLRTLLATQTDTEYRGPPALLHGDFWPGNLIHANRRVAAILDWEDAAIGDPLSDLACTCLELRYIYGRRGMERFKQAYASHGTIDPKRLALWLIYVSAAAQKYMENWQLDPKRERHMRKTALQTLKEAELSLMPGRSTGDLGPE